MTKLLIISLCFLCPLWLYSLRLCVFMAKTPRNLCNLCPRYPWLINDLRAFDIFTLVKMSLQINLFMQNKANFRKSQMNVNKVLTKDYEKMDTWSSGKNKPNSNPIKAN